MNYNTIYATSACETGIRVGRNVRFWGNYVNGSYRVFASGETPDFRGNEVINSKIQLAAGYTNSEVVYKPTVNARLIGNVAIIQVGAYPSKSVDRTPALNNCIYSNKGAIERILEKNTFTCTGDLFIPKTVKLESWQVGPLAAPK